MCVEDIEQVSQEMEGLDDGSTNKKPWPLLSGSDFLSTQTENWVHKDSPFPLAVVAGSNRVSIQTSFPASFLLLIRQFLIIIFWVFLVLVNSLLQVEKFISVNVLLAALNFMENSQFFVPSPCICALFMF